MGLKIGSPSLLHGIMYAVVIIISWRLQIYENLDKEYGLGYLIKMELEPRYSTKTLNVTWSSRSKSLFKDYIIQFGCNWVVNRRICSIFQIWPTFLLEYRVSRALTFPCLHDQARVQRSSESNEELHNAIFYDQFHKNLWLSIKAGWTSVHPWQPRIMSFVGFMVGSLMRLRCL